MREKKGDDGLVREIIRESEVEKEEKVRERREVKRGVIIEQLRE